MVNTGGCYRHRYRYKHRCRKARNVQKYTMTLEIDGVPVRMSTESRAVYGEMEAARRDTADLGELITAVAVMRVVLESGGTVEGHDPLKKLVTDALDPMAA